MTFVTHMKSEGQVVSGVLIQQLNEFAWEPRFFSSFCYTILTALPFGSKDSLLAAWWLLKLWALHCHKTISSGLRRNLLLYIPFEQQGGLSRSSLCRLSLRSHWPEWWVTCLFLNQSLTREMELPWLSKPSRFNHEGWRGGQSPPEKHGYLIPEQNGNTYSEKDRAVVGGTRECVQGRQWRVHHSRVIKQKHLQARSNSSKGTFSDDHWIRPCFTDELLFQE